MEKRKLPFIPKDQYSLAYSIVYDDHQVIQEFSQIVNRALNLANLGKDDVVRIYQEEAHVMISYFNMAIRDNRLKSTFFMVYYGWLAELNLTRAKDGMEIKKHYDVATSRPYRDGSGSYGDDYSQFKEDETSLFEKVFGKRKKQPEGEFNG